MNKKINLNKIFIFITLIVLTVSSSLVSFASEGESEIPDHIILSWSEDTKTTQSVVWRNIDSVESNKIQYVKEFEYDKDFTNAKEIEVKGIPLYSGYNHFEVTMRELEPGTIYMYRVGSEGNWSETSEFETSYSTNDFSFLYMGDVQSDYKKWGKLLHDAYYYNPMIRFGVMGGDLVNYGSRPDEWIGFLENASPVFSKIPMMPTIGNHEVSNNINNKAELYLKTFALPKNGPKGYEEEFYSFDYGNSHFVMLESNFMGEADPESDDYKRIQEWLREDLKNSDSKWKFVTFHHPPYPVVNDRHAKPIRENWVPILEEGNVDIALVGHQHVYMRTKPMKNETIQEDGIVYIMGNSGNKFYPKGNGHDYIEVEIDYTPNYQIVDIHGDTLRVTSYDPQGNEIDYFERVKQKQEDKDVKIEDLEMDIHEFDFDKNYSIVKIKDTEKLISDDKGIVYEDGHNKVKFSKLYNSDTYICIIPESFKDKHDFKSNIKSKLKLVNDKSINVLLGDINLDGKIDIQDVERAKELLLGGKYSQDMHNSLVAFDVNNDKKIDIADIHYILLESIRSQGK